MKEIVVYAIVFKVLLLLITLTLTLLFNKLYSEVKGKELRNNLIYCMALGIIEIFFSICNLFYNFNILFYIYIFILLGLLSYSVIKNKLIISKYLFTYSAMLLGFYIWGINKISSDVSMFESYILSITLSPISYGEKLNLNSVIIIIVIMLVTTLILNLKDIKFVKHALIKLKTKINETNKEKSKINSSKKM